MCGHLNLTVMIALLLLNRCHSVCLRQGFVSVEPLMWLFVCSGECKSQTGHQSGRLCPVWRSNIHVGGLMLEFSSWAELMRIPTVQHFHCKPLPDPFSVCVCVCLMWACFPTAELLLLCQHGFIRLCMCRTQTLIAVTNLFASDVKENRRQFIWHGALSSRMNQTSHKCPWNLSEVLRAHSFLTS